ncbi:hypothetical protein BH10ACI4_BH10ACI4_08930 [soil metagenome]
MNKSVLIEPEASAPAKPGRQEARTRETRDLLMRAAKTIFIRDGYEGTDLNDIAELAGRTKGAIYGHFKGKEEIFLALIAQHRQDYRDNIRRLLSKDPTQNIALIRKFLVDLAEDHEWALLQLEFKMYILRNPEAKKRYQDVYTPWNSDREEGYAKLIGAASNGKRSVSRAMVLHSIIPMLSALLLEAQFDPDLMTEESIKNLIGRVFDCLVGC